MVIVTILYFKPLIVGHYSLFRVTDSSICYTINNFYYALNLCGEREELQSGEWIGRITKSMIIKKKMNSNLVFINLNIANTDGRHIGVPYSQCINE